MTLGWFPVGKKKREKQSRSFVDLFEIQTLNSPNFAKSTRELGGQQQTASRKCRTWAIQTTLLYWVLLRHRGRSAHQPTIFACQKRRCFMKHSDHSRVTDLCVRQRARAVSAVWGCDREIVKQPLFNALGQSEKTLWMTCSWIDWPGQRTRASFLPHLPPSSVAWVKTVSFLSYRLRTENRKAQSRVEQTLRYSKTLFPSEARKESFWVLRNKEQKKRR